MTIDTPTSTVAKLPFPEQRRLLEQLDEQFGVTAGDVGSRMWPDLRVRSAAQLARHALNELCELGLARRLGDQTPVCWFRTRAGTESLT